PGGRAQIAQGHLVLTAFELRDLPEFGGIALAGAAGEVVEDAPPRAVDRTGAARFDQAEVVQLLMRQKRAAGGVGPASGEARSKCQGGNRPRQRPRATRR